MAKILVSFSSHIFDKDRFQIGCFYEGFIEALRAEGNDVFALNSADFLTKPWSGDNKKNFMINEEKLKNDILNFSPDMAIIFNNSTPQTIKDNLNCPIFLWGADAIEFFNEAHSILENLRDQKLIFFTDNGVKGAINFGVPKEKVFKINGATGLKAESIPQEHNISFIGSNFINSKNFINLLKRNDIELIRKIADDLRDGFFSDYDLVLKKHNALHIRNQINMTEIASLGSSQDRISILNLLTELGLTIYGSSDWYSISEYLPWISLSYNPRPVYSLKHNQDIYNGSKICINISHSQSLGGMGWCIMDIMASNGCLVSDKKNGVAEFTKGYIDIPLYETPLEAYDLCKKLLADPEWRKDIVLGSQACIEEKGRWKDRLKELESLANIKITDLKEEEEGQHNESKIIVADPENYTNIYSSIFNRLVQFLIFIIPEKFYLPCYKFARLLGFDPEYKLILKIKTKRNKNLYSSISETLRGKKEKNV